MVLHHKLNKTRKAFAVFTRAGFKGKLQVRRWEQEEDEEEVEVGSGSPREDI